MFTCTLSSCYVNKIFSCTCTLSSWYINNCIQQGGVRWGLATLLLAVDGHISELKASCTAKAYWVKHELQSNFLNTLVCIQSSERSPCTNKNEHTCWMSSGGTVMMSIQTTHGCRETTRALHTNSWVSNFPNKTSTWLWNVWNLIKPPTLPKKKTSETSENLHLFWSASYVQRMDRSMVQWPCKAHAFLRQAEGGRDRGALQLAVPLQARAKATQATLAVWSPTFKARGWLGWGEEI